MPEYRLHEIGAEGAIIREVVQSARSPEEAAFLAFGVQLVRATGLAYTAKRLRAKAYAKGPQGQPPAMVRLYEVNPG